MDWLEKFNPYQRKYILFLAMGQRDDNGRKMSKEKYAKAYGHDATTLYDWQRLPGFKEAVFHASIAAIAEYVPKMVKAQVDKAVKLGDTPAFMAVMRQSGLLQADRQDITTNGRELPTPIVNTYAIRTDDSNSENS